MSEPESDYLFDLSDYSQEDLERKKKRDRCEVCIKREAAEPLPALPGSNVCHRHMKQLMRKKIKESEQERTALMEMMEYKEGIYSSSNKKKEADTKKAKELIDKTKKRTEVQSKIDSELATEFGKLKKLSPVKKAKTGPAPIPVPTAPFTPLYPYVPPPPMNPFIGPDAISTSSSSSTVASTTNSFSEVPESQDSEVQYNQDFTNSLLDKKDATISEFSAEVNKKADELVDQKAISATNSIYRTIKDLLSWKRTDSNI